MYTVDELLSFNNEIIKRFCIERIPGIELVLKDERMKRKLIDCDNKYELIWLVQEIPDDLVLILFDELGLDILSKSNYLRDKMNAIMTSGKSYVNDLLNNVHFCELIISDFQELSSYFNSLDQIGALTLAKYVQDNYCDLLESTLLKLSKSLQKAVVSQLNLSYTLKKRLLIKAQADTTEYLLEQISEYVDLNDYQYSELLSIFSKMCVIPSSALSAPVFINKLASMESVKDYRFLIDVLEKSNDCSKIIQARRTYYDKTFMSYDKNTGMLKRYYNLFIELCALMDEEQVGIDQDKLLIIYEKYFNFFGEGNNEWNIKSKIGAYCRNKDKRGLETFLINESNSQLSNMIIDYHFEDIPFNFFLDVKQLLHFQQGEGRTLTDEYLEIYTMLLNIDNLSYEEKMTLHQRLSQENFIHKHYDLFREAKDKMVDLIKEQMLTFNNVQQYMDKSLSDKYGVPIYVLDGEDFIAFVKSTQISKNSVLQPRDMRPTVDGGSYSLDGSKKLDTFKDPRRKYNIIFGDFPTSQLVHMYPVDSYSKYNRGYSQKATSRVFEFYTPSEFVERSIHYNEILLAQKNLRKINDELNDSLELPTLLGIYCYDEFTEYDVESAKNLGVGIVVVKTKSYEIDESGRLSMLDTIKTIGNRHLAGIDYLRFSYEDDMAIRRKM